MGRFITIDDRVVFIGGPGQGGGGAPGDVGDSISESEAFDTIIQRLRNTETYQKYGGNTLSAEPPEGYEQ